MRRKQTLIWLFGLLALLLVVWPLMRLWIDPPKSPEEKAALITQRLERITADGQAQLNDAYRIISGADSAKGLRRRESANYTALIYRNGILVFWSDNNNSANRDLYAGLPSGQHILDYRGSRYLVQKQIAQYRADIIEMVLVVPLYRDYLISNQYLASGPCPNIFPNPDTKIRLQARSDSYPIYVAGQHIFNVSFEDEQTTMGLFRMDTVLILLSILLFLLVILFSVLKYQGKGRYLAATVSLVVGLLLLRFLFWLIDFPTAYLEGPLFDSRQYASSRFNPSMADLMLNIGIPLGIVAYIFGHRKQLAAKLRAKYRWSFLFIVILSFAAAYAPVLIVTTLKSIYRFGQWEMDINVSVQFGMLRLLSLLLFVGLGVLLFMVAQMYLDLLRGLVRTNRKILWLPITLFISFHVLLFFVDDSLWPAGVIGAGYLLVVWGFYLDRYMARPDYLTYLYLFSAAIAASLLGGFSIYQHSMQSNISQMEKFAAQLVVENDPLAEYLLHEAALRIKQDNFIKNRFLYPSSRNNLIEEKVRRAHIPHHFEKYDLSVYLYDANGRPFMGNPSGMSYKSVKRTYEKLGLHTEYPDLYLNRGGADETSRQYLSFIPLEYGPATLGYIILELNLRKIIPNSVYPQLLQDERSGTNGQDRQLSYAVIESGRVMSSLGNFNYRGAEGRSLMQDPLLFGSNGVHQNGFKHLGFKGKNSTVIVSRPVNYFRQFYSNFAFFFITNAIFILLGLLFATVALSFSGHNINFATRVQAYINVAFFLPLIVLSITMLSVITRNYRKEFNDTYKQKAERVASEIVSYLERSGTAALIGAEFDIELRRIAQLIESDINLYDSHGILRQSTRPNVYELGLLSQMINPAAYFKVVNKNETVLLEKESIGNLDYNAVYVALNSYETGQLMGILSIPYFDSQEQLDQEIAGVLSTTNNIFVTVFILFLLISYFASRVLTDPLRMIARSLRRTSLSEQNEPLEWHANDEIGGLVAEYNKMIHNLEASKVALSKTEKESAWREMAKQVAHEIKNPLTPMKLKLQHLLRAAETGHDNMEELTKHTAETLLDQVQTLDTIASSFSDFATMPVPINRIYDLNEVVQSTVRLFNNKGEAGNVVFVAPSEPVMVKGDDRLMGQIISNLLINAFQSIPGDRRPEVSVNLQTYDSSGLSSSKARLSISDNGSGIPEDIRDKVFLPNFSTKYTGSGIGLALAKRGIEHAEGNIHFETELGVGTTFVIELPVISNVPRA